MFAEEVLGYLPLPIELIRPIRFQVAYQLIRDKLKFPIKRCLRISDNVCVTWNIYLDGSYQIKWSFCTNGDDRAYSVLVTDTIIPKIVIFASLEFFNNQFNNI